MRSRAAAVAVFAAVLAAAPSPASADAIDGEWCSADGRSLSIDGPAIRTPEGTLVNGDYRRHEFAYVAPAGAPDAGRLVYMRLFGEEDMGLATFDGDRPAGDVELWKRCNPTS